MVNQGLGEGPATLTWLRRVVGTVIVSLAAGIVTVSHLTDELRSCQTEIHPTKGTAETCGPISPADVLPLAGVGLLAFLPDLDELAIGGVSLRREIRRQGERQEHLERQLIALNQTFSASVQRTGVTQVTMIGALEERRRLVEELGPGFIQSVGAGQSSELAHPHLGPVPLEGSEREQLRQAATHLRRLAAVQSDTSLSVSRRQVLRRWLEMFGPDIEAIEEVAERGKDLPIEEVTAAVQLAKQLLHLLEQGLSAAADE